MIRRLRITIAFVSAATALSAFTARDASAQVHWDASAQVGVAKRFLFSRPPGGSPDAGFGPAFQVNGHVALFPLLRAGLYVGGDQTDVGSATRQMFSFGARVVGIIPKRTETLRGWIFAGFGSSIVFAPSYHTTLPLAPDDLHPPVPTDLLVSQAGANFFEVPFGVGGAWSFRPPFELVAELGARVGFGFSGSVYEDPGRSAFAAGFSEQNLLPAGKDAFSTFLTVGIGIAP